MVSDSQTADVIPLPFAVPGSWGTPRLSQQTEFVRDGDWIESKDQGGADYRLLQISNIGVGRFVETGNYRWITEETFRRLNCTELQSGDVLVARMPEPTGRAWCIPTLPWRAITAVDVAIIRTRNRELDPRFLSYFLNSPACLGVVEGLTTGTTRLRIRRADIERLQVPLPTLAEQRAIAHILGTLDDKIDLNRRMAATLEEMARAVFEERFGSQAGSDKDWPEGTLDEAFALTMGQSPPGDTYNEEGCGIPFYQGRTDFGFRFPSRRIYCTAPTRFANSDDTLVSVRAPVGDINRASERCAIGRGVAAVRHKRGYSSFTYYMMAALRPVFAIYDGEGTVFGSIGSKDFLRLPIPLPPDDEIAVFERVIAPFDARIHLAWAESNTLTALRDTLLPKLISGDLRVKDAERFLKEAV